MSGQTRDMLAGETIAAGDVVYNDTSVGPTSVKKADGNASLVAATGMGIALNGGGINQPIVVQTSGDITIGATIASGAIYVLSVNAGKIAPVADLATGTWTTIIGVGKNGSTTVITLAMLNSGAQVP